MTRSSKGTALITGASSGIGAVYADRLAERGHDLILVARNRDRLDRLKTKIIEDTGRTVEVIVADLNDRADLARVGKVLGTDSSITVLINNAGIGATQAFVESDIDKMERMIDLNVSALVRLTYAVVPAFLQRSSGTIVNIASVVALAPDVLNGVYGGTKAFVHAFSLSLHKELAPSGIRIQVVLPGATATNFWAVAGTPLEHIASNTVMQASDLVDAAISGLEHGELVTIPSLSDIADWEEYEAARRKLLPTLSLSAPAARYGLTRRRSAEVSIAE